VATKPLGILCPQCNTPINSWARFCSGCGIDISVITLVLEHAAASTVEAQTAPYVPEVLVPRLGEFLIQREIITESQLQQALEHQKKQTTQGAGKMLGETLIELGMVSRPNIERAIVGLVLELQTALQASNRQLQERVAERTAELEEALKKVNEINHLKVDFVSNISHELRTPLAQIKGYVVLMSEGMLGELNSEQTDAIRATVAATERLEHLIEDLIRFASAARGELVINSNVFSLSDLAQSMVNRSIGKAHKSNLQLKCDIPDQPIFVRGDVEKLSWVILQLIDNAIKFTPGGGSVTLTVKPNPNGRSVNVTLKDTGIGIPPERIPELFQAFHQLDSSSTRRYGGTGLGLALVMRIAEAHDTRIRVESEVGKGTTFSFDLPVAKQP